MGWLKIGLKLLPFIVEAIRAVEAMVTGRHGKEKEDAAVGMVHAVLQAVETGADKDLLNDEEVNRATRSVMQSVVALQNIIAAKRQGEAA